MQPGVQSPACPCLLPVPKPNDSQIPDANSMMNSCSQCPSWAAVACAAASGLLDCLRLSVLALLQRTRSHAVTQHCASQSGSPCTAYPNCEHGARRCHLALQQIAQHTRLHLVACGCICFASCSASPTTMCVCGHRNGHAGHAA